MRNGQQQGSYAEATITGQQSKSGLQRDFYRLGPDFRCGDDVSFNDIQQQFALATIKVGRWVTATERQLAANLVFDALADLAFILNVPPTVLGLKQSLHLSFGTGGSIHSQAHYAPYERTLALAKNAGAGALAHEFWHAFDHYIADKLFPTAETLQLMPVTGPAFASHLWQSNATINNHPLNRRLADVLEAVLDTPAGESANHYLQRAEALDRQMGRRYFSIPTELVARAFESYIQDDGQITNHYLVSGTKQSELAKQGGYPCGDHRQLINQRFSDYFLLLGRALLKSDNPG